MFKLIDTLNQRITDTGRIAIFVLTLGAINRRRPDRVVFEVGIKKRKRFLARLWFLLACIIVDNLYFFVGVAVWISIILGATFIYVAFISPIPPIHQ